MSLNYSSYVQSIANLMPVSTADPYFQIALPNAIDDAEQRLYRELDFLATQTTDTSGQLSTGTPVWALPSANGTFMVVADINVITPVSTPVNSGARNPLIPCSLEFLQFTYPSSAGSGVPQYFGMVNMTTVQFGPWPDQTYNSEVIGEVRPTPLSSTNVTTILSVYFPDLMVAAGMVFIAGYMQNYGAQGADNPQMASSWEGHLQALLKSAQTEEARRKFTSQGWSSQQPDPLATPQRT